MWAQFSGHSVSGIFVVQFQVFVPIKKVPEQSRRPIYPLIKEFKESFSRTPLTHTFTLLPSFHLFRCWVSFTAQSTAADQMTLIRVISRRRGLIYLNSGLPGSDHQPPVWLNRETTADKVAAATLRSSLQFSIMALQNNCCKDES